MPRRARFTYDDAVYHILSRGNNKQQVFFEPADYEKFLELLIKYKNTHLSKVYHYVLMSNHYHLIMCARDGGVLAEAMKGLNLSYAKYYRRKYGGVGYLWQGRFKSFVIQTGLYILECGRYIELNPVRAGLVDDAKDYPWSSYIAHCHGERDSIIEFDPEYLGLSNDPGERRTIYKKFVSEGLKEKRTLNRFFRAKTYGDAGFIEMLKKEKGLIQGWPRSGRPPELKSEMMKM